MDVITAIGPSLGATRAVTIAERPRLRLALAAADARAFPAYLAHSELEALWPAVYEAFPEHQLVLADAAARRGLRDPGAAIRPTGKHRHPLTSLADYARRQRADGLPLDPWIRVHARLGAEQLGVAHGWSVVRGTLAQWEAWTGTSFSVSGAHVVPGALVPVEVDLARDSGTYLEPHLWMRHVLRRTS